MQLHEMTSNCQQVYKSEESLHVCKTGLEFQMKILFKVGLKTGKFIFREFQKMLQIWQKIRLLF